MILLYFGVFININVQKPDFIKIFTKIKYRVYTVDQYIIKLTKHCK